MSTAAETIKERLGIVDVVSSYVTLEKAGRQFKAKCPFHSEKSPSFYVSPERNSFHCFGCNASGDIFSFVEKIEGVAFKDALVLLADRAHVNLSEWRKGVTQDDSSLYEVLEHATQFFEQTYHTTPVAMTYSSGRGIHEDTIQAFRVGFAPQEWHALEQYLSKRGVPLTHAEKAGLIVKKEQGGGYYDRFRGRLMFPITNASGKVIGFSGRILPEYTEGKEVAKYINSPETELYKKSKVLFGYDKAKRAMTETSGCIIVEGQMDLVMAHQAHTQNTVAVSGTALTFDHLRLIQRFTNTVLFCLDSDKAGLQALRRSAELAYAMQMEVKVIPLIDAKDPADLIRDNPHEWQNVTKHAISLISFLLQDIKKDRMESEYVKRITKDIIPLVRMMTNAIEQAVAVRTVATELGISEQPVWNAIKQVVSASAQPDIPQKQAVERKAITRKQQLEALLIGGAYAYKQDVYIQRLQALATLYGQEFQSDIPQEIQEEYAHRFEAEFHHDDEQKRKAIIDDLFKEYEKELAKSRSEFLMNELKKEPDNERYIQELQKTLQFLRGSS